MERFIDVLKEVDADSVGLEAYQLEISSFHPLAAEEEYLLAKRYFVYRDGNDADRLVDSQLKLVVNHALSFTDTGLPVLELIYAGNEGLMTAVRKFNPERSFRLSGYASWWIRCAIKDYIGKRL